jgi:hypothetical protein
MCGIQTSPRKHQSDGHLHQPYNTLSQIYSQHIQNCRLRERRVDSGRLCLVAFWYLRKKTVYTGCRIHGIYRNKRTTC